jgi:hypothetical protein
MPILAVIPEPVIGPAKGRTRWANPEMTKQNPCHDLVTIHI